MIGKSKAIVVVLSLFIAGGVAAWQLMPISHVSQAAETLEFELDCGFDKSRQIMVRKNATRAIVDHGGMELLSESVQAVEIDSSKDARPLLNAIRGTSRVEVDAVKTLTVRLNEPGIQAEELTLRQISTVQPDRLFVETSSAGPQAEVKKYLTTLTASAKGSVTRIELSIDMAIEVRVPKLFVARANAQVRDAAKSALHNQRQAISELVMKHRDERLILPDLLSS